MEPFGPRLSQTEYRHRLHEATHPPSGKRPTVEDHWVSRRAMLDALIDYRLGVNFPQERREALWKAQQDIEQHPYKTIAASLRSLFRPSLGGLRPGMPMRPLLLAYATVLTQDEMDMLLAEDDEEATGQ